MGVPRGIDARVYFRCAGQRHEESEILLRASRTTGAVYLAGYGVECILKSLIMAAIPAARRPEMLKSFRGNRAHAFEWLREQYLVNGGAKFPKQINQHFTLVNSWSTDLRYEAGAVRYGEAEVFINSAGAIIKWAEGRL